MKAKTLSQSDLSALVASLVAARIRVIAPVRAKDTPEHSDYLPIKRLEDADLTGPLPRRSLKEFFLPPSEVLLRYQIRKDGVEIEEVPTTFPLQVLFGVRPCDAAGIEILDRVMGWDYRDELWFGRREATTTVSLACTGVDGSCFCTAVGLGPDAIKGSDVLLVRVEGSFLAQAVTPKGEALLNRGPLASLAEATSTDKAEQFGRSAREKVGKNLPASPDILPDWLARNFDHGVWKSIALRCHGCGACASICPTCHCFDIVDEHEHYDRGVRRRNWDSCQTTKFTLHASNYNPRSSQVERFRQRVMHKFSIYPRRFGAFLCTGCGRCSRGCPAGMNLPEVVGQLIELARAESQGGSR
ncbi:MAG: 4Fe-4S dicluster domain-containing protein [Acidobacteriia bacterium]|nr:4Fe-4S dicluster domain-containing protein [Terriglobia bacterium]